jgi:hypothetical protein
VTALSPTPARPVYDLLPVIHRLRDAENGLQLSALLSVVEDEVLRLRDDVSGLYDDWFIETCSEWVVAYIADLLGVQGLRAVQGSSVSQRALVANTLRYRRGKGTPAVLESVARDVTGWPARVVEYFQLIGTTQHLDHLRLDRPRTADLRDAEGLALVGSPFDPTSRTLDVRHLDPGRGRYHPAHVGLHLWRLAAYRVQGADARAIPEPGPGRWTFDPAGREVPLFHPARPTDGGLTQEHQVPAPLRRRALLRDLAAPEQDRVYLAEPDPAFRIRLDGTAVPAGDLVCCDLSDWHRPASRPGADQPVVAVDPLLGRLTIAENTDPGRVQVDYAYGLAGDLGAGPFDRRVALGAALQAAGPATGSVDWLIRVSKDGDTVPGRTVPTLGDALLLWNTSAATGSGRTGVIAVVDSGTYHEELDVVVPGGDRLLLVAANLPVDEQLPLSLDDVRLTATGLRPHLVGDLTVTGDPDGGGGLLVDGLQVEGRIDVLPGDLDHLVLSDVTVLASRTGNRPETGWVTASGNPHLAVSLLRSVCAGIRLPTAPIVRLTECLLYADSAGPDGLDAPAAAVELDACTVLGCTRARILSASTCLLLGRVEARHRQEGCIRFSYLPLDSRTARRHHCLPTGAAGEPVVVPSLTSVDPAAPGFGQLAVDGPGAVATGADDEDELGVFHFLHQSLRLVNLSSQLDQYLRFGLEAGIFLAT